MKSAKVAVSLPAETLRSVERARRKAGLTRSAVFQEAVEFWLRRHLLEGEDREYVEGYLRKPERSNEVEAIATAATAAWEPWE
jgi:metal-responsive CopG/Arc/MetJ family transcriptional regulator